MCTGQASARWRSDKHPHIQAQHKKKDFSFTLFYKKTKVSNLCVKKKQVKQFERLFRSAEWNIMCGQRAVMETMSEENE